MSQVKVPEDDIGRLLESAAQVTARIHYCWLLTQGEDGLTARPMGRIPSRIDADRWTIRFVTDRRSRKTSEIQRSDSVQLIFQDEAKDAFVVLIGNAAVLTDPAAIRQLWKDAYRAYFPGEEDRANASFVEVEVQRMRLWIRGVTPEPFGFQPLVLERDAPGDWRLEGTRPAAPHP
jgi:general stress protein 26